MASPYLQHAVSPSYLSSATHASTQASCGATEDGSTTLHSSALRKILKSDKISYLCGFALLVESQISHAKYRCC